MAMPHPIRTQRLDLMPVSAAMLDALIAGDGPRLGGLAGAEFPDPFEPPPLFGEHAVVFRARMREHPGALAWRFWFLRGRESGAALGVAGLPSALQRGTARIGYSIYPHAQGFGYATEAVEGLVGWLLARPEVSQVQATIASGNAASLGVARKAGMHEVGVSWDEEGELLVFERRRPGR